MRIIGGKFRGTKLHMPETTDIRPTADKTRQAIFNLLTNSLKVNFEGKKVADICAGTGALGFEALSHGTAHCIFYDKSSLSLIQKNAEKLKCNDQIQFVEANALDLPKPPHPFDLIFIDPPYRKAFLEKILPQLILKNFITNETLIICEEDKKEQINIPPEYSKIDHRNYGKTQIILLKKNED